MKKYIVVVLILVSLAVFGSSCRWGHIRRHTGGNGCPPGLAKQGKC